MARQLSGTGVSLPLLCSHIPIMISYAFTNVGLQWTGTEDHIGPHRCFLRQALARQSEDNLSDMQVLEFEASGKEAKTALSIM